MLSIEEITNASNGKLLQGDKSKVVKGYKIDSRIIEKGDFFIPLTGESQDGHKYIKNVYENGAIGSFVQKGKKIDNIPDDFALIEVEDTLKAMQDIAKYNREKHMSTDVISITGSVGKTSTRQMVASVFSLYYNTLVTEKNYNGHIGLPLMMLKLESEDIAILETGIDFVGEMNILGNILKPNCAVITNIGNSHIEKFGSKDVIYTEKTNIANSLQDKKKLILNRDNEYLAKYSNENVDIVYYSIKDAKDIKYYDDKIEYDTKIYGKSEHIVINAIGNHNILNSLVPIKLSEIYNIPTKYILKGISDYRNFERRMVKEDIGNITIIDDTYNASVTSALSGLQTIDKLNYKRKIVVLADILELGKYSKVEHERLAHVFKDLNIDMIISYGENMKYLSNIATEYVKEVYSFNTKEEAEDKLEDVMKNGDLIYFKGSNAMKVNEIIEYIKNKISKK